MVPKSYGRLTTSASGVEVVQRCITAKINLPVEQKCQKLNFDGSLLYTRSVFFFLITGIVECAENLDSNATK